MKGQLADIARFKHIRDAATEVIEFVGKTSEDEFCKNIILKYAVEKCLIVICEAASKISKESIEDSRYGKWRDAIGMRGKLVHDYNRTNYVTVYLVATQEMKPLLEEVNRIIAELEEKYNDELK
jgi:uncharacterized protein with HEPN domain